MLREAMFYEKLGDSDVRCHLCSHNCLVKDRKRGICGVRENRGGILYSLVYGKAIAAAVDPIEKKPLFHFYPGSKAYSIATVGCNFRCSNCQNYSISQMPKEKSRIAGEPLSPERVVSETKRLNCKSIAYTYTEPTIFYEYAYETAKIANKEDIKNVFVTNGYITEEALKEIAPYLHAANIDLKSFSDDFYRKVCGAHLEPVLDSIRLHKRLGIWIEITTLIIPTLNDSEETFHEIAAFIKDIGPGIPWHVTQFYPMYKLSHLYPTPIETIRKARSIGIEEGLKYVYAGNVHDEEGENTYCYNCNSLLIRRYNYTIIESRIEGSKCPYCGARIDGLWK